MTPDKNSLPSPRRFLPRIRRLAVTAVATYAAVCVLLCIFQSHLIYFPTRDYAATPSDIGLSFDDLTLEAGDGVSIAAWYVPCADAKGSVIFCHGNAGNISDRLYTIELFHNLGYHVLAFDYRGYGRSEGSPGEAGTYRDAEVAWRYVVDTRGESPLRVVVCGRSLGGAVAVELATHHAPAALVLDSTFTCLADIGRIHYPLIPVGLLLVHRYDSAGKIHEIMCPKLFFHATNDDLIPLANARKLFEAAAPPKQFIETPGGHNTGGFAYSPEYVSRLAAFMDAAFEAAGR